MIGISGVREWRGAPAALAIAALAGCAAPQAASNTSSLPAGAQAYALIPPAPLASPPSSYTIAALDVLDLRVFDEPDLSNDSLQVDSAGNIEVPLIGEVVAAGRTPDALATEIATRLRQRYLVKPQVAVSIKKLAPSYVTVEGQVNKPGVYEIQRGGATLLAAIARAESPTRVARLDDVVVFRQANGKRMAARFDLRQVRAGQAPDPRVVDGDVVVVGYSTGKGAWRDLMQAAPLFNIFYVF